MAQNKIYVQVMYTYVLCALISATVNT